MDFAIMSKTYREARHTDKKEFVSLETSLKDQYGAVAEEEPTLRKREERWNAQQKRLLGFATRLGLLAVISLVSSFLYQVAWIVSLAAHHEIDDVYWFTYTWNL